MIVSDSLERREQQVDPMPFRYEMVVPYGENLDALRIALPEMPTKKIILLAPAQADRGVIDNVRRFASEEGLEFENRETEAGAPVDGFFALLSEIKHNTDEGRVVVNLSVGTPMYSHILLCAAMATGVMAFGVFDRELVFLPISCSISHGQ